MFDARAGRLEHALRLKLAFDFLTRALYCTPFSSVRSMILCMFITLVAHALTFEACALTYNRVRSYFYVTACALTFCRMRLYSSSMITFSSVRSQPLNHTRSRHILPIPFIFCIHPVYYLGLFFIFVRSIFLLRPSLFSPLMHNFNPMRSKFDPMRSVLTL